MAQYKEFTKGESKGTSQKGNKMSWTYKKALFLASFSVQIVLSENVKKMYDYNFLLYHTTRGRGRFLNIKVLKK